MLHDVHVGETAAHRRAFVEWLRVQKENDPTFTVIDVGGTAGGWSHSVVDWIVDIHPAPSVPHFSVNLNRYTDWDSVRAHVATHGLFSFAICSHTLEDIANPMLTLDMLPQIAKQGVVMVPSKYREFAQVEGPHLGYIHHRWVFDVQSDCLVGYPKLGFLEHDPAFRRLGSLSESVADLQVAWSGSLPYRIVNEDYLGPTADAVRTYYRALLSS